jgi:phosphotransferase system  glucose/maltose/N-acetylglucosamine-specific IIC component
MSSSRETNNFDFWRYLINIWSILFFAVIVWDFVSQNSYQEMLNLMSTIYIGALAVYVSNKEFERWYHRHRGQHPGEMFVVFWTILTLFLIVVDFIPVYQYNLPGSVISSYIAVLTILAVTRKSKQIYRDRYPKR